MLGYFSFHTQLIPKRKKLYKSINNETFDEDLQTKILYKHTIQSVRQLVWYGCSVLSDQRTNISNVLNVQAEQVGGSTRYVHVPIMFASWLSSLFSLQVVGNIGELRSKWVFLLKVAWMVRERLQQLTNEKPVVFAHFRVGWNFLIVLV